MTTEFKSLISCCADFDMKHNQEQMLKYLSHPKEQWLTLSDLFDGIYANEKGFYREDHINTLIEMSNLLGDELLEKKSDSVDQITKCIKLQFNNFLSYLETADYYNVKDEITTLKFIALITFKITKGHFMANGNKRIGMMVMFHSLMAFGFKVKVDPDVWNKVYDEWKHISAMSNNEIEKGVKQTYQMMLNCLIETNNVDTNKSTDIESKDINKQMELVDKEIMNNPLLKKVMQELAKT